MKSMFKNSFIIAALLFGACSVSNAQVKIGTSPTTIDPNSNLEIQSTNGSKVSVHKTSGKVTIADGTQGDGKVLTSDANGVASWQSGSTFTYYASQNNTQANPYLVASGLTQASVGQRIPFTPVFGVGYNASNKAYVIPTSGYYRVSAGVRCRGTLPTRVEGELVLFEGKFVPSDIVTNLSTTSSTLRSFSVIGYYPASTEVFFYVNNGSGADISCYSGYMALEKITPPSP